MTDAIDRPAGTRSIEALTEAFRGRDYITDRSVATAVFLALELGRPLLLEGEAGVGKTELAKVLATSLGARLIRLQCYEGLDVNTAVYEWNYPRQMLEIRLLEARGEAEHATAHDIFGDAFLIRRPLLQALESTDGVAPVLLIDEIDRADEEFEAYLLEILSDFQVTVPEIGTIKAERPPRVILTSNRTREVHDALKRRCLYHWIDYPTAQKEYEIVLARVPGGAGAAGPRGRRVRPSPARGGPDQGPRHRRDPRLGRRADVARRARADARSSSTRRSASSSSTRRTSASSAASRPSGCTRRSPRAADPRTGPRPAAYAGLAAVFLGARFVVFALVGVLADAVAVGAAAEVAGLAARRRWSWSPPLDASSSVPGWPRSSRVVDFRRAGAVRLSSPWK